MAYCAFHGYYINNATNECPMCVLVEKIDWIHIPHTSTSNLVPNITTTIYMHVVPDSLEYTRNPKNVIVKIEKISPDAIIPTRANSNGVSSNRAYYDVYSNEDYNLEAMETHGIHTGIKVQCEPDYFIDIRPRSGLALHHSVTVANSPGTIDPDYGGELIIILINHGREDYFIHKHDRIAQMNVAPVYDIYWHETKVDGTQGLGSTGK